MDETKRNLYVENNGKIGETKEVYPSIQVTFDTIVIFDDPEHGKIARKHIQTFHTKTYTNIPYLLNSAYEVFKKDCETSMKKGKYREGADIKII